MADEKAVPLTRDQLDGIARCIVNGESVALRYTQGAQAALSDVLKVEHLEEIGRAHV